MSESKKITCYCSFCEVSQYEVKVLISARRLNVAICNKCLIQALECAIECRDMSIAEILALLRKCKGIPPKETTLTKPPT